MKRKPLTDEEGEVRELTREDFKHMRPAREVLPPELYAALTKKRGARGAQKAPVKRQVTLRLDAQVVEYFRNSGEGWQSRINELLKAVVAASTLR